MEEIKIFRSIFDIIILLSLSSVLRTHDKEI